MTGDMHYYEGSGLQSRRCTFYEHVANLDVSMKGVNDIPVGEPFGKRAQHLCEGDNLGQPIALQEHIGDEDEALPVPPLRMTMRPSTAR